MTEFLNLTLPEKKEETSLQNINYTDIGLVNNEIKEYYMTKSFINSRRLLKRSMVSNLIENFTNDFRSKKNLIKDIDENFMLNIFVISFKNILGLSPHFVGVEITNLIALFFVVKINNLTLHLEIKLDDEQAITVYNIYRDNENILTNSDNFDCVFDSIKSFIKDNINSYNRSSNEYTLSGDTFTEHTI